MIKYLSLAFLLLLCAALIYQLGKEQCQTTILTNQKEMTQNVTVKKAKIYSRPNENRDVLLELMRNNTL